MADGSKRQWPELVGKEPDEAEVAIKSDRPDVNVQVLNFGQPATRDYRENRVRILLSKEGKVMVPPCVG